jgi:intracellular sulfur oxidation DsrE/DsrF family protein
MPNENGRTPRREFIGRLGLIAAAAAAIPGTSAAVEPIRRPRETSPWDMSWVERIAAAPYKCVVDCMNVNDGAALGLAADIMDMFHEVYGGPDEQTRVVVVMRQLAVPLALQDALWDRYAIGEDRKIDDPVTKSPARRNPFLRPQPGEPSWAVESKLEPLMARGLTVLVCNRATMNTARGAAERAKRDVAQVQTEFRNGLVPGALLMPDGIFALVRAQNAGCALMRS